jgi:hypothetical protein
MVEATQHVVRIAGRSRTADLIDCQSEVEGGEFRNSDLAAIARAVAQPFGVQVVAEADVGAPFDLVAMEKTETVFAFLERLARLRGVLLTDDPQGRLVIARADSGAAAGRLVQGDRVLAGSLGAGFVGASGIVSHEGVHYACARVKAPGYREFKQGDRYDNGVEVVVGIRLGTNADCHASVEAADLQPMACTGGTPTTEVAVFDVGGTIDLGSWDTQCRFTTGRNITIAGETAPGGIAIIGGVLVSTFLTLFVVPAFYLVCDKIEQKGSFGMIVQAVKEKLSKHLPKRTS